MIEPNYIVQFTCQNDLLTYNQQVIIDTINKAFMVAKGDLEKMKELHQLAKELRYQTELAIDELMNGPVPKKESFITDQPVEL